MPPKTVTEKIVEHVRCALRLFEASDPADDLAPLANISKSTARRYLEFLTARGAAVRDVEYRPTGRPSHRYRIVE